MREFKHIHTGEIIKVSSGDSVLEVLERSPSWKEVGKVKVAKPKK